MFEVSPATVSEFREKYPESLNYRPVLDACEECIAAAPGFALDEEGVDAVRPLLEAIGAESAADWVQMVMMIRHFPNDGDIPVRFNLIQVDENGISRVRHCEHRCACAGH